MTQSRIIVRHPTSGEHFDALVEPVDAFAGQDRITAVVGPLDANDKWFGARGEPEEAEDAEWLSRELGATIGEPEENVYGETLWGLLRQWTVS